MNWLLQVIGHERASVFIKKIIQCIRARKKQKYSCGWMRRLRRGKRIQMAKKMNSHPYFIEPKSLRNMVRNWTSKPQPGAVRAGVGSDGLGKAPGFSHTLLSQRHRL